MHLIWLLISTIGFTAHARPECYSLLTFQAQAAPVNAAQRNAALVLDLTKLSPPQDRRTLAFSAREQLVELSAANRLHLLERLKELEPLEREPSREEQMEARDLAADFVLHYLHRLPPTEPGRSPPLLSPREERRAGGPVSESDFFSELTGDAASVGFDVIATSSDNSTYNLGAQVHSDQLKLDNELAREHGFVLPDAGSPLGLIGLFEKWDPQAVQALLRHLRYSLPPDVRDIRSLSLYLTPERASSVFPASALSERLAPLRTRLFQFVLTQPDAQLFLRDAFTHFLLRTAQTNPGEYRDVVKLWKWPGVAQRVFRQQFLPFLGWPRLSLRVPVSVSRYYIVRSEGAANRLVPDRFHTGQRPWDSRRLDREAMP